MIWYVYLLECSDATLYCGVTTDLERREKQHNSKKGGAKYTRMRQPVKMIWFKECGSQSDACKEEYRIKKLSRKDKLKIITD